MIEVVFKVICSLNEGSCARVQNLITNFKSQGGKGREFEPQGGKGREFEHSWKKEFSSALEADMEAERIRKLAGRNLSRLTLHIE